MYLLDTDICIYLLNRRFPGVEERLRKVPLDQLATTAITAAELYYGALKSGRPAENLGCAETFLAPLRLLRFDGQAAMHFAKVKRFLAARGQLIGTMDLLIAACALAVDAILVTHNVSEFSRVPSLRVENWVAC